MDSVGTSDAVQLLRELDNRQEEVLAELDVLNQRIEHVLELYLEARRPQPSTSPETPESKAA